MENKNDSNFFIYSVYENVEKLRLSEFKTDLECALSKFSSLDESRISCNIFFDCVKSESERPRCKTGSLSDYAMTVPSPPSRF